MGVTGARKRRPHECGAERPVGGVSSEAAQKAYPEWDMETASVVREQRKAFDRGAQWGAVEALRQAAAELDASAEWVEGSFMAGPNSTSYAGHTREAAERLRQMADGWAGQ